MLPSSDLERLARIEQDLRDQYHPRTRHQQLLISELAKAHFSLELMGDLMLKNVSLVATSQPNALALSARVDFPWPEHASELLDLPWPFELQRELARHLMRWLNDLASSNHSPGKHANAQTVLRRATERLLDPTPILRDEVPWLWRRVDRLMALVPDFTSKGGPNAAAKGSSALSHNFDQNPTGQGSTNSVRVLSSPQGKAHRASTRPQQSVQLLRTSNPAKASPAQGIAKHLDNAPDPGESVNERARILYWLLMNHQQVVHERAMMVNERRMAMLADPNVSRAQAQHIKRIFVLERQLLDCQARESLLGS